MCLLSLLNAPANLLDVLGYMIVTEFLLLHALGCGAPVVELLLNALGNSLFDVRDDPLLNRS